MILEDVKIALRVTHDFTDGEISDLIAAASGDLINAGILAAFATDYADPWIKRAIILYCKSHYGYDNPEASRFQHAFDELKLRLAITDEYTGGDESL